MKVKYAIYNPHARSWHAAQVVLHIRHKLFVKHTLEFVNITVKSISDTNILKMMNDASIPISGHIG